jgi:hypothetical protein
VYQYALACVCVCTCTCVCVRDSDEEMCMCKYNMCVCVSEMHACVYVCVGERCVYASMCMCVREIRMYWYVAGVPFVPLPVSVFILLHVHGPWSRAPLSSERCVLHCVRLCILLLCVCVYVCVRESVIQRDLRCGPCPCVYAYRLVLCASILSLSPSLSV